MATDRNTIPNLYSRTFDELFQAGFESQPALYQTLFDVRTDNSQEYDVMTAIGMGIWSTTAELENLNTDAPYNGYTKTFTHTKYTNGYNVSFEAVEDDEQGEMDRMGQGLMALGQGAATLVEQKAAAVFNNAFSASAQTTPDAQALCSNNHPRKTKGVASGTAGDNLYTGTLTHDNLATFEKQIADNSVNDRGLPIVIRPSVLLVPPALEDDAMRIVSERAQLRPGTANNDINVYSGKYDVVTWPYLSSAFGGSDTAWFLVRPKFGLRFFWRKQPTYVNWINEKNESYWFGGSMRFSVGPVDWRGVWGSQGTA